MVKEILYGRRRRCATRRRRCAVKVTLALTAAALTGLAAPALAARPNIITILTDDQGFGDAGFNCDGGPYCPLTPHLDKLMTGNHSAYFHR